MKHLVGALWFYLFLCNVLTIVRDRQRLGELDSVSVTVKCLVYTVKCAEWATDSPPAMLGYGA